MLRIFLAGIVGFILVNIISMQIEISQKKSELDSINNELNSVLVSNEQLKRYTSDENKMEYIEQIARDQLDYSYSDETVYYFVPR
ncbi:MAG: septum formation initiator family protein [Firmicutes bacterium]|nr:septum formation initiator family protein [[Eubacterium] siraeum]MCM1487228.1 septum formation initiator family protein [Bacillota bacterium]